MIATDLVSHFVITVPIQNKTAAEVAWNLHNSVTLFVGGVKSYHSDNGGEFVNNLDEINQELIKYSHTTITPYNPQENGMAEAHVKKYKKTMNLLLKKYCDDNNTIFHSHRWPSIWCTFNQLAMYRINSNISHTTGIPPVNYALNKTYTNVNNKENINSVQQLHLLNDDNTDNETDDENENEEEKKDTLTDKELLAFHKANYSAKDKVARARAQRKREQYKAQFDKQCKDNIPIGTKVKYVSKGNKAIPLDGCLLISGYTKTGKAQLKDATNHHIVTCKLQNLRMALKSDHVISYYDKPEEIRNLQKAKKQSKKDKDDDAEIEEVINQMDELDIEMKDITDITNQIEDLSINDGSSTNDSQLRRSIRIRNRANKTYSGRKRKAVEAGLNVGRNHNKKRKI